MFALLLFLQQGAFSPLSEPASAPLQRSEPLLPKFISRVECRPTLNRCSSIPFGSLVYISVSVLASLRFIVLHEFGAIVAMSCVHLHAPNRISCRISNRNLHNAPLYSPIFSVGLIAPQGQ